MSQPHATFVPFGLLSAGYRGTHPGAGWPG